MTFVKLRWVKRKLMGMDHWLAEYKRLDFIIEATNHTPQKYVLIARIRRINRSIFFSALDGDPYFETIAKAKARQIAVKRKQLKV